MQDLAWVSLTGPTLQVSAPILAKSCNFTKSICTETTVFIGSNELFRASFVACTTNLVDTLDPAAMRRFDIKLGFKSLNHAQAQRMVHAVLKALGAAKTNIPQNGLGRLTDVEPVSSDSAVALR